MLAEHVTDSLSNEGIITDEEKEIVRFGLENLEGNLLGFVMTLTIGYCFCQIKSALLLWLLLFPLRKNAGGYHASTKMKCYFTSVVMILMAFIIYAVPNHTITLYLYSVLITGIIIWVLVPVDNSEKKLDETEHKIYRIRSKIVLTLESIFFIVAVYFKWEIAIKSIAMTFSLVSVSLLMGIFKMTFLRKNDG